MQIQEPEVKRTCCPAGSRECSGCMQHSESEGCIRCAGGFRKEGRLCKPCVDQLLAFFIGVGVPIIFQAMINMGVAVQVLPVTGQTLPMVSSGGTAAWMTCIAFGVILSVSSAYYKKAEELEPKESNVDNPLAVLSETI